MAVSNDKQEIYFFLHSKHNNNQRPNIFEILQKFSKASANVMKCVPGHHTAER